MEKLGDVELSQNVFCDIGTKEKEQKTTVFNFLNSICGESEDGSRIVKCVKAAQNFTDEDIKNILVFVANLENNDVSNLHCGDQDDKISSTLPSALCNPGKDESLQIKKAYVILVLISFDVSPTR